MRKSEAINFLNLKFIKTNPDKLEGLIYIPLGSKLITYSYPSLEKTSQIEYNDEILNFHLFKENESHEIKTVLLAKSNKSITIFNGNREKENEFIHYKKITNSILIEENNKHFLIFSDKFGEIYIKKLQKENFSEAPKALYGHSDPIHFMKISPSKNLIASADILGKIKICEFPNVFNVQSVLFYENEDVILMDFFSKSNRELVVLDSKNALHFWSVESFKTICKIPLEEVLLENTKLTSIEIISIMPYDENLIYVETKEEYFILEKQKSSQLIIRKKVKKHESILQSKNFFLEEEGKVLSVGDDGKISFIYELN